MFDYLKRLFLTSSMIRRHAEFSENAAIPLSRWLEIREDERKKHPRPDALLPLNKSEAGYSGQHDELVPIFNGVELGTWAINRKTMDWLWENLTSTRPKTILEFGSGSSTCMFCAWIKAVQPASRIVSIDQSEDEAHRTADRLAHFGLSKFGEVMAFPLDAEDRYTISKERLSHILNDRKADMVFVDGPAGKDGCREGTLKDAIPFLSSHGQIFLHDALRDGELQTLQSWSCIKGITIEGILPYGSGLGVCTWTFNE